MTRFPTCHRRPALAAFHRIPACWVVVLAAGLWWECRDVPAASADEPTAAALPAATSSSSVTETDIRGWIDQLSDDSYTVRRAAADRLLGAGMAARPALVAVTDGPDPETRAAARRLVALIDRTEFSRRLSAFANDTDGKLGATLPGWETFTELVGDDARARALFVEMQRAEAPLLAKVFGQLDERRDNSWEDRLERLMSGRVVVDRRHGPPLGSCATMLLLGTLPKPQPSVRSSVHLARLAEFPAIRDAIQGGQPDDAVRRLVSAWIIHCPNDDDDVLMRRLPLASTYGLADTLPLALAVASDPEYLTTRPSTRVTAILTVGKLGGPEHVDDLEPLLEDDTDCLTARTTTRQFARIQIRDVALAVMLHLTGQNLQQYGYPAVRRHVRTLFTPSTLYFASEAQRDTAIEKWHKWRAEHPAGRD